MKRETLINLLDALNYFLSVQDQEICKQNRYWSLLESAILDANISLTGPEPIEKE